MLLLRHVSRPRDTGTLLYVAVTVPLTLRQIYALGEDLNLPEHLKTYGKTTLLAAASDDGSHLVHVRSDAIAILKPGQCASSSAEHRLTANIDLTEAQSLKLPRDNLAKDACVAGGYILLTRANSSHSLYSVESGSAKLTEVPLPSAVSPDPLDLRGLIDSRYAGDQR